MVTIGELRSGARPRISEKELAQLRGCSVGTVRKDRVRGTGVPFLKDPETARVTYAAETVLAYFDRAMPCYSTSEYDTSANQERLDKARKAQSERRKQINDACA